VREWRTKRWRQEETGTADTQAGEDEGAAVKRIAARDLGWGMENGLIEDR
jgi:hypothetical protein